jgi:hypothetical protein
MLLSQWNRRRATSATVLIWLAVGCQSAEPISATVDGTAPSEGLVAATEGAPDPAAAGTSDATIAAAVAPSPVSIAVSTTTGPQVYPRFAGLSYEKGMLAKDFFHVDNTGAVGLFKRLGHSSLRIGGGTCDTLPWHHAGPGGVAGEVAAPDVDALAAFLANTGWTAIYCVNLKTGTPALAADEVAYVTSALGSHLAGIEIGNEPDNYGWPVSQYIASWQSFAAAVRQRVPGAVLTAPALGSLLHDANWVPAVTAATPHVQRFTQHFYITCAGNPLATLNTMITPAGVPYSGLSALQGMLAIPYRMAETNSFCGGGQPGASDTFGSALWAIDLMFGIANHGGLGANFHTRSPNSSSVLIDVNGSITEVRPIYYGLLLFSLGAPGTILTRTQDAHGLNVTSYALSISPHLVRVFVLDKTASTPIAVTIDLGRPVVSAKQRTLAAPALDATSGVTLQGATVGLDGSFSPAPATPLTTSGTTVNANLPPSSAALIDVVL